MVKLYDMNLTRKNTRRWTPAWSTPPCATARCLPWSTPPTVASTLQTAAGDDKHYFPDYTAAPVVRQVYLDAHPELAAELAPLAALFDDKTMRELNARVDVDHSESLSAVAADFLRQHPLPERGSMEFLNAFSHLDGPSCT
jgi:osmoprotectant transport system substrate-binding protein